jgi:small-conductance mechanosensitive channel
MVNDTVSFLDSPDKFKYLYDLISPLFSQLVVAIILLLIGFVIGKVIGRLIQKALQEVELNKMVRHTVGLRLRLEQIISGFVTYFIYFVSVVMALEVMNLRSIIVYLISGGVILIIILSVILGIKDFMPNFFAGLTLHRKGLLKEGDKVKFENVRGVIIDFTLNDVKIEAKNGDVIFVPNAQFLKSKFVKLKK